MPSDTRTKFSTRIRLVCFDFDGTLADTMRFLTRTATFLIANHYGLDPEAAKVRYIRTTGLPFKHQLDTLFPNHAKNPSVVEAFEREKKAHYLDHGPSPQAKEVLDYLRNHQYRVAISSSTSAEMIRGYLERFRLDVDIVLGYDDNRQKGKDHFSELLREYGLNPDEILYVGDSLNDYVFSKQSGVHFVGKTGVFSKEDFREADPEIFTIDNLSNLKEIL